MTECFPPREKKGFAHYVSLLQHARAQMTATEKNPWLFGGKDLEKRAYISTDGETGEEQDRKSVV